MNSNMSNVSKDTILEENTMPRPLLIPNALVGYFGDLILSIANYRVRSFTSQKDSR